VTRGRRRVFVLATALLLAGALPAAALVDVPAAERRTQDVVDLASGSGLTAPLDVSSTPFGDAEYLRAYRALHAVGLVDPLGEALDREATARADGKLHLETLVPAVGLKGYFLGGVEERALEHSGGLTLSHGFNSVLSASGSASWGTHLGGAYELQLNKHGADFDYLTKRLYLKGTLGKWSLKLGRDTVKLGPGYHGSLLLDDNARPFDLWEVRTEEPVFLPWIFEKLGGWRVTVFNGFLSDSNPSTPDARYGSGVNAIQDPRLFGMRLSYHPTLWLDLGFSRTVLYSGKGRETYDTVKDWWELLTASNENVYAGQSHKYDNDQYAAFDATLWLPFLRDLGPMKAGKVYWEHGGTDFNAPWSSGGGGRFGLLRTSNLAGLYLSTAVTDLRCEYARIHNAWYRHGQYPQGYTYQGLPLGHHAGPDSKDLFVEVARYLGPEWRLALSGDYEKRGLNQPAVEGRTELGLGLETYSFRVFGAPLTGRLDLSATRVTDPLDDPGTGKRNEWYLGLGVEAKL
jgi:hypothetical protein